MTVKNEGPYLLDCSQIRNDDIPDINFKAIRYDEIKSSTRMGSPVEYNLKTAKDNEIRISDEIMEREKRGRITYQQAQDELTSKLEENLFYKKIHGGNSDAIRNKNGEAGFPKNYRYIDVVNGDVGTVAIKIPLSEITNENPLLSYSGTLSGCT